MSCKTSPHLPIGDMDCVRFGSGSKTLILLPGLGHSLREEAKDFQAVVMDFSAGSH